MRKPWNCLSSNVAHAESRGGPSTTMAVSAHAGLPGISWFLRKTGFLTVLFTLAAHPGIAYCDRAMQPAAVKAAAATSSPVSGTDLGTLGSNSARDLGVYNCANVARDGISCRTITDYSGFTYDAKRRQMLMFGGGHSATMRDDVDQFSFKTLKWKSATDSPNVSTTCDVMWVSGPKDNFDEINGRWISTGHATSRHTYDMRVVTRDGAELVILKTGDIPGNQCSMPRYHAATNPGKLAHYDIDRQTWRFTVAPRWDRYAAAELDPVSGKIVILDGGSGIWVYDPVADTTSVRIMAFNNGKMGYANNLVYFPPNDRFYYFNSSAGRVWEVSLKRSADKVLSASIKEVGNGAGPKLPETGFAYDAANRVIGGGVHNSKFYVFDPVTQAWTAMTIQAEGGGKVGTQAFHALDYDPVANVYLFITNYASGSRVWAYRFREAPSAPAKPPE